MPRRRKAEVYIPDGDFLLDNLRNTTMSDQALLDKMHRDCTDGNGLIDPADVAEALNVQATDKRTPSGTVSTRLSWMKRYGMVERIEPAQRGAPRKDGVRYRITAYGHEVRKGKVSAALKRELEKANIGTEVAIMREVTLAGFRNGNGAMNGRVLRRQFQSASGLR